MLDKEWKYVLWTSETLLVGGGGQREPPEDEGGILSTLA